jgi:TonB family protein
MHRRSIYGESEKMIVKRINRREIHRSFTMLFIALIACFALTIPMTAQDGNVASPAQQGPDARGVYKVGGDVSAPALIHSVEPEYPEGSAKGSGNVEVTIWVDLHGNPTHVRVTHGLGMGLDQKAVEAVRQYKYKPAMKDGKPVLVELNVLVKF